MLGDRGLQSPASPSEADDLVAAVLEQAAQPLAQEHLILGDQDSHGSSAISVVPEPGALSIRSVPP